MTESIITDDMRKTLLYGLPKTITIMFDPIKCNEEILYIYYFLKRSTFCRKLTSLHSYPQSTVLVAEFSLGYICNSTYIISEINVLEASLNKELERGRYNQITISLLGHITQ